MRAALLQARRLAPESVVLAGLAAAWGAGLAVLLSHRVVVSNDSLSNYAHVWHVAGSLAGGQGIPFYFPEVGHGEGFAFPYAFVPWMTAALLRPLLGDWVVTCWLVVGFGGVVVSAWFAFPELRRPLPAALFLANPFLVESVLLFQMPFLWASAFLFAAVGAWRRGHPAWAIALAMLCESTHPAIGAPLLGMLVLAALPFERDRWHLVRAVVLAGVLAAPAAAVTLLSPALSDAGVVVAAANLLGTVSLRALVVGAGPGIAFAAGRLPRPALWVALTAMLALNVALIPVRHTAFAWQSLARTPDQLALPFIESPAFTRAATYRVLRAGDGKVTMYQVLQGGGRLDSEFFPESFARRSWGNAADYRAFLDERKVDYVMLFPSYTARFHTNEQTLLEQLRSEGCALPVPSPSTFSVFNVAPCRATVSPE